MSATETDLTAIYCLAAGCLRRAFNESLFIKDPGVGAAVSWHQDGKTHRESEHFDEGIHGFNFMAQVYGSRAVNGIWVKLVSHKVAKLDIKQLIEESGSERIEGRVTLVCNRQLLHGSFPNCGFEPRVTVNFGFHRRSPVLGVQGPDLYSEPMFYDEALIEERSKPLGYAIDARKQRFSNESSYQYQPFIDSGKTFRWIKAVKAELKDYNLRELSI